MKKHLIISMGFILVGLLGCATQDEEAVNTAEEPIKVVTTIAQIADAVENIGGEHVDVTSLMGPGVDPHLYSAVQGDIQTLDQAEIIFYSGLHLEGQMEGIFEQMEQDKTTTPVSENIPEDELLSDPESPTITDPHVWFDISMWSYSVEAVRNDLIAMDPENKETYSQNAAEYLAELAELDAYAKERFEEIPEESRVLVTAHDAFNYFGKAYGFEVVGLQGLSTESDYSVNDVQQIINLLIERNVKGVFVESSVSDRSINAVVEGAKEAGHDVSIGGELYSDAMGEAGTEEGTYIGMFKHNIDTIVDALK